LEGGKRLLAILYWASLCESGRRKWGDIAGKPEGDQEGKSEKFLKFNLLSMANDRFLVLIVKIVHIKSS
jgi:hypothetical protein